MRGVVAWAMGALLMASAVAASADQATRILTAHGLRAEMGKNRRLAAYVSRNGYPDVAELKFLADRPPWDKYEVTIYYLGDRREVSFARAYILGDPSINLSRYERQLTDDDVAVLQPLARQYGPKGTTGPAARAEAAAERAERAATRVENAAERAERAADRTEAIVAKLDTRSGFYK
ncbi:MAG: hypothetical protein KIT14_02510 [bacterium]|nr:hypothetical protein [bacterium]